MSWRNFLLVGISGFLPLSSYGSQSSAHQEGRSFAQSLLSGAQGAARSTSPNNVPGYVTDRPSQAEIPHHELSNAATETLRSDEAGQHVVIQAHDRQTFKIDPSTDPLFTQANQAILNPERTLHEEVAEEEIHGVESEQTVLCEESGEESYESGEEIRTITAPKTVHHLQARFYSHGWGGGLSRHVITDTKLDSSYWNSGWSAWSDISNPLPHNLRNQVVGVSYGAGFSPPWYLSLTSTGVLSAVTSSGGGWFWVNYLYVPIAITYRPIDSQITETITNTCQQLEEKVEKGLCVYDSVVDIEGPGTRHINDYIATRNWWKRKKVYRCRYPSKNDCAALRAKGCYQVSSACKQKVAETCVVWEQTLKCPTGKKLGRTYRASNGSNPFCLTGNCADSSYTANGEMLQVMSQMAVLREVQKELREFQSIFKGNDRRCSRNCLNFRDCCGSPTGWGVSIKLSQCSKQEDELFDLRKASRCVMVGTYCSEKERVTGICLHKKTTFCCFESKLSRLLQEQGRQQLGRGWGSPESPDCSGLTPEELSRIDFTRINFAEIFDEIRTKLVVKDQGVSLAQVSSERLQQNMTLLTRPSVNPEAAQQLQQRGY